MTIARRGLKVKVKVVDPVNAGGSTSIEGSFFPIFCFVVTSVDHFVSSLVITCCFVVVQQQHIAEFCAVCA